MKNQTLLLCGVLALGAWLIGDAARRTSDAARRTSDAAAQETVVNAGFETVEGKDQPAGWKLYTREAGSAAILADESTKVEGRRSLKVVSTGGKEWAVSQDAKVKAAKGDAFALSVWMRADKLTSASAHVIQYTPKGERATWFLAQLRTKETHDWKEFRTPFLMPQDGFVQVRLMGAGTGTVWFDNVRLGPRTAAQANEFAAEFEKLKESRLIPLLLHERAGSMRFSQPITVGVCFPKGYMAPDGNLQVLDDEGRTLTRQWLITSHWDDGSAKWATVDFQADILPNSTRKLTVDLTGRFHPHYTPPSTKCMLDAERAAIGSGAIMAVVSQKNMGLFDAVAYDAEAEDRFPGSPRVLEGGADTGFEMVMNGGKKFTTGAGPAKIAFEESAYMKAVMKAEGTHIGPNGEKGFDYTVRVSTYAARPLLRIQYTFTNRLDAEWTHLEKAALRLRPAFKISRICLGGEFGGGDMHAANLAPEDSLTLRQLDEKRSVLTHAKAQGAPPTKEGGRAAGWAAVAGGGLGLTLGVKDFAQNFPTGLAITPTGIEIELISPQKEPFAVQRGAAKTYEIWLEAHNEETFPRAPQMGPALTNPVWAALPPAWYAGCRAFGEALPADTAHFPFIEKMVEQKFETGMRSARLPGWINWGDYRWQNTEVDYHHGLFVQFMRTGDPRYMDWATAMARHSTDLDIKHYDTDPAKVGGGIRHRDYFDKKEPLGTYNHTAGGVCTSHTWLRGYIDAFFLTGDWRYMDVAREVGDFLIRRTSDPNAPGGAGGRESGRMLEQLMALYAATEDEKYLTAAKKVVDFLLEIQQGDGSWFSFGRQVKERRRAWGAYDRGGHCSGVILSGIKSYHEATGDERVVQPFLDGVDYMMWEAMTPEQTSFLYGTTMGDLRDRTQYAITRRKEDPFTSTHMLENLTYGFRLTCNQDYLEIGQKVLRYMTEKGQIIPHMFSCYGTPFLSLLHEEGANLTEIPESLLAVTVVPERLDLKRAETATLRVRLLNRTDDEIETTVALALPAGLVAKKSSDTVTLSRNIQGETAFEISAAAQAAFGPAEIKIKVEALDGATERRVDAVVVERRLGYIGETDYHADVALRKMGLTILPITNMGAEDLSRYEVIFVGVEAHNKDSAGIRANYQKLNDYVRAGGVALVFQLNDENWRPEYLPYALYVSDEDGKAGKVVATDSPVFAGRQDAGDIGGMVLYDTLRNPAPEWKILAEAEDGSPAIVEARFGKGYVLVCQPSADRYYAGTIKEQDPKRLEAYGRVFERIVRQVLATNKRP